MLKVLLLYVTSAFSTLIVASDTMLILVLKILLLYLLLTVYHFYALTFMCFGNRGSSNSILLLGEHTSFIS